VLACAAQQAPKPLKFSGEVKAGQAFHKPIGRGLAFVLKPDDDGWTIEVQPDPPRGEMCRNFSTVIAKPLKGYTANDLDVSYGVSAADAVKEGPRELAFVTNEGDCKREHAWANRLTWPKDYSPEQLKEAEDRFGRSAGGWAKMRIVQSKISPSGELVDGKDPGKIDWIKFDVEITFAAEQ